jgi:hypothetical protein
MQDKYAGDVGDFGKFVLLNELLKTSDRQLRLGINWYRVTRPEKGNNDGRHVGYLDPKNSRAEQFQACNPIIYSKLKNLVETNDRSVEALERTLILPTNTIFFSTPLPYNSIDMKTRVSARNEWLSASVDKLKSADLLFLDPDNGIASDKVRKTQARSIKYTFVDELQSYSQHHDLVIQKFTNTQKRLGPSTKVRLLRFERVSVRYYAFFFKPRAEQMVLKLFHRLIATPFNCLFGKPDCD